MAYLRQVPTRLLTALRDPIGSGPGTHLRSAGRPPPVGCRCCRRTRPSAGGACPESPLPPPASVPGSGSSAQQRAAHCLPAHIWSSKYQWTSMSATPPPRDGFSQRWQWYNFCKWSDYQTRKAASLMCFEYDATPPDLPAHFPFLFSGAVSGEDLVLTSADGTQFSAYLSRPGSPGGAGIVILPDVRGLFRFYKELADRFATAGIQAIAVDYFGRSAGLSASR